MLKQLQQEQEQDREICERICGIGASVAIRTETAEGGAVAEVKIEVGTAEGTEVGTPVA